MKASTFFMTSRSPKASGAAPAGETLSGQARREDPVGLQAEAEALAVLAERGIEARELLHPLQAVGDRVAVHVERGGRRPGGAVVLQERLERRHQLGAVG